MEDKQCYLMHELMNCLTVVLGECELLLLKNAAEGKERLEIIRERTTHMAELVRHYDCPAQYEPHADQSSQALFRAARLRLEQ